MRELEAAEQVCRATPEGVPPPTGAGLVRRDHDRILMLETIREYSLERLAASSDEDVVRRRHAEYFLRLAAEQHAYVAASERLSPVDLSVEDDNLREALRWSREADAVDVHLLMAASLAVFWDRSGTTARGRRMAEGRSAQSRERGASAARARSSWALHRSPVAAES